MVDRGGLENRCACKRTVGSNPTLSAIAADHSPLPEQLLRAPFLPFAVGNHGRAASSFGLHPGDMQPDLPSLLMVQAERRVMNQFPARLDAVERQGLNHLGRTAG